jgi:hypothetical protein
MHPCYPECVCTYVFVCKSWSFSWDQFYVQYCFPSCMCLNQDCSLKRGLLLELSFQYNYFNLLESRGSIYICFSSIVKDNACVTLLSLSLEPFFSFAVHFLLLKMLVGHTCLSSQGQQSFSTRSMYPSHKEHISDDNDGTGTIWTWIMAITKEVDLLHLI